MLDGLSADAHGVGLLVEPRLHFIEDAFMPPTFDPFELVRRALGFERAGEAYASAEGRLAWGDLCVRIDAAPSLVTGR